MGRYDYKISELRFRFALNQTGKNRHGTQPMNDNQPRIVLFFCILLRPLQGLSRCADLRDIQSCHRRRFMPMDWPVHKARCQPGFNNDVSANPTLRKNQLHKA